VAGAMAAGAMAAAAMHPAAASIFSKLRVMEIVAFVLVKRQPAWNPAIAPSPSVLAVRAKDVMAV